MLDLSSEIFSTVAAAEVPESPWISFPKLGITFEGVNTSIQIGDFSIAWYGIIIGVGMLICVILGMLNCKKINLSRDHLTDYLLAAIPSAIVGARLYYVIFSWSDYKDDWTGIFKIWNGGLAIYGGIIGAAIAIIIMAKIRKHSVLDLLDFAMPHIFLGQAIGRWGNFVNQEAFGSETDLPWGMIGDVIQSRPEYKENVTLGANVHPTFLYESLWCLLGFIILYIFFFKYRKGKGEVLALYFFIYGLERAFVEGLRSDSLYIGGLRVSQLLSIGLVVISIPLFIECRKRYKRNMLAVVPTDEERTNLSDLADRLREESDSESVEAVSEDTAETVDVSDETETTSDNIGTDDGLITTEESDESVTCENTPENNE